MASSSRSRSSPFRIEFSKSPAKTADTAIIGVYADKVLSDSATTADGLLGSLVSYHLKASQGFKAGAGQTLSLPLPAKAPYTRVVLLGLGEAEKMTPQVAENCGGRLFAALKAHASIHAVFLNAEDLQPDATELPLEYSLGYGLRLATYEFEHYKTAAKKDEYVPQSLSFLTADVKPLTQGFEIWEQLAESVFLTRNLVNEPPNKLYPESFAKVIQQTLTPLGIKVDVLNDEKLKKMGMGCMIAVGQASEHPPCLVSMSWAGQKTPVKKGKKAEKQRPMAFVGKGITFDTGGLNVKPYEGMLDMKCDMAGAAAVVGLMHMLARRDCPLPVVGIVALAENSISDEAVRPSDIITSYSGKTVEVFNTDAEGRLVLADALTYVQQQYDPSLVVDLATLTGAIMIALGTNYAGAFVSDENLWDTLSIASGATGEQLWRMPLDESFRKEMDSHFADIKNVGSGRYGGACLGAAFLSEFIDAGRPWAHLDIAGVATTKGGQPTMPKSFATGWGVRLLNEFVESQE